MNQESKRPVCVEDLLRLKRVERPPAEFWARFDRELRTKQLAALVKNQPWWTRIPLSLTRLAQYRIPLGATAVLAVIFLTVREYRDGTGSETVSSSATIQSSGPAPVAASAGVLNSEDAGPMLAEAGVLPVYDVRDSGPVPVVENEIAPQPGIKVGLAHWVSFGAVSDRQTSDLIAASLAATQAAEPAIARGLLGASRFETRAMPARTQAVEPLAQMAPPYEARRDALLQATVAMMNSVRTRPGSSATRQISDERLYDQVHRLEPSGNQLSYKF